MTATLPDVQSLTKRMQRMAWVECVCGVDHGGIYIPGRGWKCRYARGFVEYKGTGIMVRAHDCHLCNCYFGLPATTPPDKQRCDNCHGPAIPSGEPSCFPDQLFVDDFVVPGPRPKED